MAVASVRPKDDLGRFPNGGRLHGMARRTKEACQKSFELAAPSCDIASQSLPVPPPLAAKGPTDKIETAMPGRLAHDTVWLRCRGSWVSEVRDDQ